MSIIELTLSIISGIVTVTFVKTYYCHNILEKIKKDVEEIKNKLK
jgi:predicted metal-dependent hydrolase